MVAKVKNGFEPRICERCKLPFEWRKNGPKTGQTLNIVHKNVADSVRGSKRDIELNEQLVLGEVAI